MRMFPRLTLETFPVLAFFAVLVAGLQSAAIEPGQIVVADRGSNALVQIDPITGDQTVIASGPPFSTLAGLTFDAWRRVLYVSDRSAGVGGTGAIFEVNPENGNVQLISEGDQLVGPDALLQDRFVDRTGTTLIVADGMPGRLLRVNILTGEQTILASPPAATGLLFAGTSDYFVTRTSGTAIERYNLNDPLNPTTVGAAGDFQAPTGIGGPISGLHYVAENGGGELIEINTLGYNPDFPDANQTVVADAPNIFEPYSVFRENATSVIVTDAGMTPGAGTVLRYTPGVGDEIVASGEFISDPRGVIVVSQRVGSTARPDLVLTNPTTATVNLLNRDGSVLLPFASGPPLVAPTGVAVDPERGTVLIADADGGAAAAGAIFELDDDGGVTTVSSGNLLLDPVDLDLEGDGDLVAADSGAAAVIHVERATGSQSQLAALGGAAAVAVGIDGAVFAAGSSPPQVIRIPSGGGGPEVVASAGTLAEPTGLTIDPDGMLILLDASRVFRIDPDAYEPANPGSNQTLIDDDGTLVTPTAIELEEETDYLLADPGADDLIRVFSSSGGVGLGLPGPLGNVTGIALRRRIPGPGEVVVNSATLEQAVRVNPETGQQTVLNGQGFLDFPAGIASPDARRAVVTDNNAGLILLDLGTGLQHPIAPPDGDGRLRDVIEDPNGDFWAIDERDEDDIDLNFDGRIFHIDGETLDVTLAIQDPLLSGGRGIAIDAEGVLWVVVNIAGIGVNVDKVVKWDPDGVEGVVQVASGSPILNPGDLTVMPSGPFEGQIFIADDTRLVQLDPDSGVLTTIDTGGNMNGNLDIAVESDTTLVTSSLFGPNYYLLRHTIDPGDGSVEQTILSSRGEINTSDGVLVVPEPEVNLIGLAAAMILLGLRQQRARRDLMRGA